MRYSYSCCSSSTVGAGNKEFEAAVAAGSDAPAAAQGGIRGRRVSFSTQQQGAVAAGPKQESSDFWESLEELRSRSESTLMRARAASARVNSVTAGRQLP